VQLSKVLIKSTYWYWLVRALITGAITRQPKRFEQMYIQPGRKYSEACDGDPAARKNWFFWLTLLYYTAQSAVDSAWVEFCREFTAIS
jgi:hypothetical protein